MKSINFFLLLLVIVLIACPSIAAQTDAGLNQVTLYSFAPWGVRTHPPAEFLTDAAKTDAARSSINFETGERGPDNARFYDLRYGGMVLGAPHKHGEVEKLSTDWL